MTYEAMAAANATIKTVNIKNKEYAQVNEKIRVFRMLYPEGRIETEVVNIWGDVGKMRALIRATASDNYGAILGTGYAYEDEAASNINKTSFIENCETSAVGRALSMVGIGIDTSVASAEEVQIALGKQPIDEKHLKALRQQLKADEIDEIFVIELYKLEKLEDISMNQHNNLIQHINDVKERQKEWRAKRK